MKHNIVYNTKRREKSQKHLGIDTTSLNFQSLMRFNLNNSVFNCSVLCGILFAYILFDFWHFRDFVFSRSCDQMQNLPDNLFNSAMMSTMSNRKYA